MQPCVCVCVCVQAAAAKPPRAVVAKAGPGLTPRARQLYEELAAENSRVLSLDNIVDGYYISPKFLDKVSYPRLASSCCASCVPGHISSVKTQLITIKHFLSLFGLPATAGHNLHSIRTRASRFILGIPGNTHSSQ
jgi:hypothetical protein